MNKISIRIGLFVMTFGAVVLLPWWFYAVILIAQTIYLSNYIEVIFFGFFIDVMYSTQYPFPYSGIIAASVFLVLVMFIKTRIRT